MTAFWHFMQPTTNICLKDQKSVVPSLGKSSHITSSLYCIYLPSSCKYISTHQTQYFCFLRSFHCRPTLPKQENVSLVSLLATEQTVSCLTMGQEGNGKIHGIQVKPCHKGNTNEPEVLREGEEEEDGGNGLHMDLKERRHNSYVVYLMKQSNPSAHVSPLLLFYHSSFFYSIMLFTHK